MKQAFIILGHKNPHQIKRLILALDSPHFDFFIHIDARIAIQPFLAVFQNENSNIHFIKRRYEGNWGDIGIVKATISSINQIMGLENNYTHVSLISGQDYPIQSKKKIHDFFINNVDKSFIDFEPFPVQHMKSGGLERIENYSFNLLGKRHTYLPFKYCSNLSLKGKILNSMLFIVQKTLPKRKTPNELNPFYGSQWWSLNFDALKIIISFLDKNPNYITYHKHSLLPDEMFFQTILMNSEVRDALVNDNKRFILWNTESSHPISLSSSQLPEIKLSDKLFARKFEEEEPVLNAIDKIIDNE